MLLLFRVPKQIRDNLRGVSIVIISSAWKTAGFKAIPDFCQLTVPIRRNRFPDGKLKA
jgi:hypothetical protein